MEALDDVGAGELEEILFFEFFEDGAFDFDKLVGHEECEERVGVGIYSDVEGHDLVEEECGVDHVVSESQEKHPDWTDDFAASVGFPFERLFGEEAFQNILTECREEAIAYFKHVVDNVELDGSLTTNRVVHTAGVKTDQE